MTFCALRKEWVIKMKKLIIVNGTMGVGKTTVCKNLYKKLNNSVWLDGDWCWMMNPWNATEESKIMVQDNITHMLRNFINNSNFECVVFNWVIHMEEIFEIILEKLADLEFELYKITLVCSEDELKKRMQNDKRDDNSISLSLDRLKLYRGMKTNIIDNSNMSIDETVEKIIAIIKSEDLQ